MIKNLTAMTAALCLAAGVAAAQQTPAKHIANVWALGYYDIDGKATSALGGAEEVAFVRGPRNLVLEVFCHKERETLFYRIGRRVADKLDFAGPVLTPDVTVRDGGETRFERVLKEATFNENRSAYQGRVNPAVREALKLGDRIILRNKGSNFQASFSLKGSNATISQLTCG